MTALIALLDVTAERGGPAEFDRGHDAPLRRAQRRAMLRTIGVAVAAEHVRHFQPLASHETRASGRHQVRHDRHERKLFADSDEGGHIFQSDPGHHSNLMAAR